MDECLPSYQDAVRKKDVLEIVAPYIKLRDYVSLVRVSRRFYALFAPRLLKDPLAVVRMVIGEQAHDLEWFEKFISCMKRARRETTSMVAVLDLRRPAEHASGVCGDRCKHFICDLPALFPALRCLVLDNQTDLDPSSLARHTVQLHHPDILRPNNLHLMSLANCAVPISPRVFDEGWLSGLIYLDLSGTSGTMARLTIDRRSFTAQNLPYLRILKLREMGLNESTQSPALFAWYEFGRQLWAIDVSSNNLGDGFVALLAGDRLPSDAKLQTDCHFDVEGKIRTIDHNSDAGPDGRFYFIDESAWSATFSHPDRYFADTPVYDPEHPNAADVGGRAQSSVHTRSDGRCRIRGDSAKDAMRVLTGDPGQPFPDDPHQRHPAYLSHSQLGITHLHLNELRVSTPAVKRFLQTSCGVLEHLECDRTVLLPLPSSSAWHNKAPWLREAATLYATLGAAYLFRPVISSNLRVLKLHHSIVTNTATFVCRGTSALTNLWFSETHIRKRLDIAYPQTYVPDMNPRLYSLTLSMIPRYSTGLVIRRLIDFLRLAALQEQRIEEIRASVPYRGPPLLSGLRHIRLEFESDAKEELAPLDDETDELDSEALLSQLSGTFSFFGESKWTHSPTPAKSRMTNQTSEANRSTEEVGDIVPNPKTKMPSAEERLKCEPYSSTKDEHVNYHFETHTISVWVGSGVIHPRNSLAVNEYMRNLCHIDQRSNVIASTPCHVVAGVPTGSYIFSKAWDAILLPQPSGEAIQPPTKTELRCMKDVLEEIKAFRLESRRVYAAMVPRPRGLDAHEYWKGRLEIGLPKARSHSSDYWR